MSFFIKNIEIKSRVILAPMAGITSFSYRKLMNKFGVGITYSEMISDFGLIYDNKKTKDLIQTDGSDRPLAIQIFGGSKETILSAIDKLEALRINYDFLDLNLACPVPKVTKNNAGSSWLIDLEKLEDMVTAVVNKSNKPITVKIRLGYKEINVERIVRILEKCGVSFIAIHARTKEQGYTGKANYDALKNIKDIINIPFCISGDIYSVDDALRALRITRADAVMVARGGIGNPELIKNINLALNNQEYIDEIDINRQINYLKEYAIMLKNELGEYRACSVLRGIAPKFFQKFENSKNIRQKIATNLTSIEQLVDLLKELEKETAQKIEKNV